MTVLVPEPMRWWHVAGVDAVERDLFSPDEWSVESFWNELAQPSRWYRVVLDGDAVVAYAGLAGYDDEGFVQTIGVARSHQNAGLGTMLLDELLEESDRRGVRTLLLEVRTDNPQAIALYERRGFTRIGVRRGYYQPSGCDAAVMRRR